MDIRYIAKIVIEAETPLSIGSGQRGLNIDRLVVKDANHLPYIPGTSLCGVLRHAFNDLNTGLGNDLFGFTEGDKGTGSRVKMSAAHLIGEDGTEVIEGLKDIDFTSGYYAYFNRLPERDHVRMTDKGRADTEGHGKYDEELVYKGTRFAFEMELLGSKADENQWETLKQLLASPIFRIGAGTRKGFGKIKVIQEASAYKIFDLTQKSDLLAYLDKPSSLNYDTNGWTKLVVTTASTLDGWTKRTLTIKPENFFLFSAGFGDEDADSKPKTETFFEWTTGRPQLTTQKHLLLPATSLKGAIAHRVAYHFNVANGVFIGKLPPSVLKTDLDIEKAVNEFDFGFDVDSLDNLPSDSSKWLELEEKIKACAFTQSADWKKFENDLDVEIHKLKFNDAPVGENNTAVKDLFGYAKDSELQELGLRGRVIINDIYLPYQSDKVFNHTKIDRFTNGTIDGALFQEKVATYNEPFEVVIWVENTALTDTNTKNALEKTLSDLVKGELQLGGNTTKGHGSFTGSIA